MASTLRIICVLLNVSKFCYIFDNKFIAWNSYTLYSMKHFLCMNFCAFL